MTCAICGKENQAGTRFCVHCGAALAAPTGGSQQSTIATAGAILAPKSARPMAPSPSAPTASTGTIPPYVPPASSPSPANPPPPPPRAQETGYVSPPVDPAPTVPVYNADPKKAGWLVIGIAIAGLAVVGGYFGYRMVTSGGDVKDTLARMETPPPSAKQPPVQPAETRPPAAAEVPKPALENPPPVQEPTAVAPPEAPAPAAAVPPKAEPRAPRASTDKSAARQPTPPATAPQPPVAAVPPPAPARPQQQASAAPAPVADRWAQFSEELHRCERETFLSRVVCDQRVRLRYCDGYWGKVPQCPGGVANPDRGQ